SYVSVDIGVDNDFAARRPFIDLLFMNPCLRDGVSSFFACLGQVADLVTSVTPLNTEISRLRYMTSPAVAASTLQFVSLLRLRIVDSFLALLRGIVGRHDIGRKRYNNEHQNGRDISQDQAFVERPKPISADDRHQPKENRVPPNRNDEDWKLRRKQRHA